MDISVEKTFMEKMIEKASDSFYKDMKALISKDDQKMILNLIAHSQEFMRDRDDECSFVSIRDVYRMIRVTFCFLAKKELIFDRMKEKNLNPNSI